MSERKPAGGERPMDRPISVKLPEDSFKKLWNRIRHIGRLTFGELPWQLPAPCELWGTAWLDESSCLQVGYDLQPGVKTGSKNLLAGCSVITMDREPWRQRPNFWLYQWKSLGLTQEDKSYNLRSGTCIEQDDSDIRATLDLSTALPGQEGRRGPLPWQATRKQIEDTFTADEYRGFMRNMGRVVHQLED